MSKGFNLGRYKAYLLGYAILLLVCLWQLLEAGDLSLGRRPWENFKKTAQELSKPSFLDLWYGNQKLEFKSDDGRILRVQDQRQVEGRFLASLAVATWTTLKIATLGSFIAAIAALPLGIASARNMHLNKWLAVSSRMILGMSRSVHTLVFGLIIVGIIGLGPMAGILAIAAHSLGSYGKLYAENIESIEHGLIESGLALGLTPLGIVIFALRRTMLPRWLSVHLYIWEFNMRDSTVLGLIGAGGLGLLVSEAVSLFQWARLATILLATIALVMSFDALSRRLRHDMA